MLIPFFAIGTGVAAFYLFQSELPDQVIDPDTAFTEVVKLVIPVGFGIIGLISAGVIGAILSSIDSMMNSAATILTFDVYKRFLRPEATDRQLILVGRVSIVVLVTLAALMAIYVLDPNSKENFFLQIANYQNYLTPGLLVTFVFGFTECAGVFVAGPDRLRDGARTIAVSNPGDPADTKILPLGIPCRDVVIELIHRAQRRHQHDRCRDELTRRTRVDIGQGHTIGLNLRKRV